MIAVGSLERGAPKIGNGVVLYDRGEDVEFIEVRFGKLAVLVCYAAVLVRCRVESGYRPAGQTGRG